MSQSKRPLARKPRPKKAKPAKKDARVYSPHNNLFVAALSIVEVAREVIELQFPPQFLAKLRLETLELSPTSFVDEELKNTLSDIVYVCKTRDGKEIRLCFIFEHKRSRPRAKELVLQLMGYKKNGYEADLRQKRKKFTRSIAIVFYHGNLPWKPKFLRDLMAGFGAAHMKYEMDFDFEVINVQSMSDAQIEGMKKTLLIRNMFFAMKHAFEDEFYRYNFDKVFNFEAVIGRQTAVDMLFRMLLRYIQEVSKLKKYEIMEAVRTLPQPRQKQFRSAWDDFVEENFGAGHEKGWVEGMEKGKEMIVRIFLAKNPDMPIKEVAALFDVPDSFIQRLRTELDRMNIQATYN